MQCLKCRKTTKEGRKVYEVLTDRLKHFENWYICSKCDTTGKYSKEYYRKNAKHYRALHKEYKDKLVDSYVANILVDKTGLKAKDMPKELIEGKRQVMTINRILKEDKDGERSKKRQ